MGLGWRIRPASRMKTAPAWQAPWVRHRRVPSTPGHTHIVGRENLPRSAPDTHMYPGRCPPVVGTLCGCPCCRRALPGPPAARKLQNSQLRSVSPRPELCRPVPQQRRECSDAHLTIEGKVRDAAVQWTRRRRFLPAVMHVARGEVRHAAHLQRP